MSLLTAYLHDETLAEQMITGFREGEFSIDGFRITELTREANVIKWKFTKDVTASEINPTYYGMFDGETVVSFHSRLMLDPGDKLHINYSLRWFWKDEGGDGFYVSLPPGGSKGLELCFEFALSA